MVRGFETNFPHAMDIFSQTFQPGQQTLSSICQEEGHQNRGQEGGVVLTLMEDTTTTTNKGPNQRTNTKDTTEKKLPTFSNNGRRTLMGGVANPTSERDN